MTSTITSIRTTILSGNAVPDTMGSHLEEAGALRVLADATEAALAAAFPDAEIDVDLQMGVSGAGPADVLDAVDADGEPCAPSSSDEHRVQEICGQVWQAWCEAVGAGMESMEACLREGHEDALTSDALPSDSGVGADIPGEKVLGREQATDAFRAGERAALLDARAEIEDALDLDAVTEAGREDVRRYLEELTDETGGFRAPTLGDVPATWDDATIINGTVPSERLRIAGITVDHAGAAWALVKRRWSDAYRSGAAEALTEARSELTEAA